MKLKKIMLSLLAFSGAVALGACSNNNSGDIEYVEGDSNGDSGTNLDRNNGKIDGENSSSYNVDTTNDTTGYVSIKDGLKANGYTLEEVNRRAIKESTIDNVANLTTQDEIKAHLESSGYTCSINE